MYDYPSMLKGLYLSLDYNRNPIARRIVFVKYSDSTSMDDFIELKGGLLTEEELTPEQKVYFEYTWPGRGLYKNVYGALPSPEW